MSRSRTFRASPSEDVIQYVSTGHRLFKRRVPAAPIGPFPHIPRRRVPDDHDPKESARIVCRFEVRKYVGAWDEERFALADGAEPYDIIEGHSNLFVYGGSSVLWEFMKGNGTATAGNNTSPAGPFTYFNNAQSYIGVGASSAAETAVSTDLLTTPTRKGMDATYPAHTDATGNNPSAATMTWQSTFGTADANIAWNEWGIFNGATTMRMLNRRMPGAGVLGTKSSGQTWVFQVTTTLA